MRSGCEFEGGKLAGACSSFGACVIWGGAGGSSDSLETAIFRTILHNFGVWVFLRFLIQIFYSVVFLCKNE